MKGFRETGDPERQNVTETIPDGNYTVNGISKFISKDDKNNPCFVPQNGDLVVRFEFRAANGDLAPAASATPAEFWMLVNLMGGDVSVASPKQRTSSEALLRAQESVNASKQNLTVQSSNGWANGLRKMLIPPKGKYQVKLASVHRPDFEKDNLNFQAQQNRWGNTQEQLVFEFEIVGTSTGKSTLYDGYRIWQYMSNPFTNSYTNAQGITRTVEDEGCPLWAHTQQGGVPVQVGQWKIFTHYFAPEIEEHEWSKDELYQPHVVIIKEALKAAKKVVVVWKPREKSKTGAYYFDWNDLSLENEDMADGVEEASEVTVSLTDLLSYIKAKWSDQQIFDETETEAVVFTDMGRSWAKNFLSPAWEKAGLSLENRKPLHQLNDEEIERLYKSFKVIYGEINQESGW